MDPLEKKRLSERDICTKFITPAITASGWDHLQIREEVNVTNGRVLRRYATAAGEQMVG